MEFVQVRTIPGPDAGPGKFTSSLAVIAIGRGDLLYAAGDSQVKVFDAQGQFLRQWSTAQLASAIALAGDGAVWVGEAGQVEIFDGTGKLVRTWRDETNLGKVTSIGFFEDNVLVADAKDRAIRRFGRDLRLRNTIGKDNRMKGFLIPNRSLDFSVDKQGVVHAANPGKHRVERYTLDGRLLGHIGRFDGLDPAGFGGCCNPTNVTLGPRGWVYVTEKAEPRAKVMDAEGKLLAVIADRVFGLGAKNMDIALDSRGRVFVADTDKLQVRVFESVAGKGTS